VLARLVLAVVALSAIGWLAVMERDARLYDRGIAAGGSLDDPKRIARAEADLEGARLLSPDRTPDVGRSLVLWTAGRSREARALLEDVVRAEPDNLSAWTALGWVNDGEDPALERRVRAEMRRLDPLSAGRRPPPPPAR
jgi:Tetratricopeptide repeat